MNLDVKEKLLEALRSGEYKQGQRVLRRFHEDGDSWCCLGVLCDIYNKTLGAELWERSGGVYEHMCKRCIPHEEVRNWSELDMDKLQHLVMMNDEMWKSFSDIADWVEEYL